jgi:hypothetical protein
VINFFLILLSLIVIVLPDILILPPNRFKNKIKSFISGSIAQFFKIVLPFAIKAASNAFSVAPTELLGNFIVVPFKPFLVSANIYPFLIFIFAPSFFKANKCKSTGLVPIAQPPGRETFAFPYLVNNEPKTKTPALIVFTSLYGAKVLTLFLVFLISSIFFFF